MSIIASGFEGSLVSRPIAMDGYANGTLQSQSTDCLWRGRSARRQWSLPLFGRRGTTRIFGKTGKTGK